MPVSLFLIRHGIAAERGETYPDDSKRPLTNRGVSRLRREVQALGKLNVSFDQILTSPLVRTRQTAEIIAEALSSKPPIAAIDSLAPGGTYAALTDDLAKYARRSKIALVGHEPNLGEFAGRLIGTRTAIEFKKGAICEIEFEALPPARAGRLRWFLTPKMLRRIGK
jgi:phosphohistidine phosphatase